ncbi:MAG TPA: signal peptide peptidase SppA [Methanocella sp.]|jgi:protease-4
MEEKKRGLSLFTLALIGIILVLGVFLIIESVFIVAAGNFFPDLSSPLNSKVAVIYVEGEMVTDGAPGPGYAGSGDIVRQLRAAEANPGIKAIVLRINSPGGSPVAAQDIYSQLLKTREVKPVVVSMSDMATSAAYYISSACDEIYAAPDSWTGSIGVIWPLQNSSAHYEQEGISFYVAKSGEYKDIGADWRGLSDEEKVYVDGLVNETFDRFVDAVATGRNMSTDKVRSLADGRVFTGVHAKELGLIDEIGDLYDAIDAASKLAKIEGTPVVAYLNDATLMSTAYAGQSNGTRVMGHYQPYYSPYGRIYL